MNPIITFQNVSFAYPERSVLKKVSFTIPEGDFVALVGPNGSGKTTIVKLILGLLQPATGSVTVLGQDRAVFRDWHRLAYVPQQHNVDKNYPGTVREILSTCGPPDQRIAKLLEITYLEQQFRSLSGGQQQRVLIALALQGKPKLLIFDEPEGGIDARGKERFYTMLKHLNEDGITILVVTHDLSVISKHVHMLLCIDNQRLHAGPAHDAHHILASVYGGAFERIAHKH